MQDGYLTADEISEFLLYYYVPHYLEKALKDPNVGLWVILPYAMMIGDDLEKAKANYDKKAANVIRQNDKNGDGKLSRAENEKMVENFKNEEQQ